MTETANYDAINDYLYRLTLEGFHDEETGSVDENGTWYGLITGPFGRIDNTVHVHETEELTESEWDYLETLAGAIVSQDSLGFKYYEHFTSQKDCETAWQEIQHDVADFYGDIEEQEESDEN